MLDEIPFEIRQHHVQKVRVCGERPLDFNFIDFRGPRSSVGEFLEALGRGGEIRKSQEESGYG